MPILKPVLIDDDTCCVPSQTNSVLGESTKAQLTNINRLMASNDRFQLLVSRTLYPAHSNCTACE